MAIEILSIPEEHLKDVILVIEAGLKVKSDKIDVVTIYNLKRWIKEEKKYLKYMSL